MKKLVLIILTLSMLSCEGKHIKTPSTTKQNLKPMETLNQSRMSCKLTTPELQKRKATVIKELKTIIQAKEELSNGFSYQFEGTDHNIDLLSEFIKTERRCCDFFNFKMSVTNDNIIHFDITGADRVKEFITSELEL